MIELSSIFLKKIEKEFFRIIIIIYILINTGYLIFNILLGIFALILKSTYTNDWGRFLEASGYSYNQKLVFMLFVMVILFAYLNYTTKKMRSFIPVIKKLDVKK
jgi:small-conductance mechanosensitive channel